MSLLKLPTEVRMVIWEYVFAEEDIFINFSKHETPMYPRPSLFSKEKFHRIKDGYDKRHKALNIENLSGVFKLRKQDGNSEELWYLAGPLFDLIYLCKQTYYEIKEAIWTNCTWVFYNYYSVRDLVDFLTPQQRRWVRYMVIIAECSLETKPDGDGNKESGDCVLSIIHEETKEKFDVQNKELTIEGYESLKVLKLELEQWVVAAIIDLGERKQHDEWVKNNLIHNFYLLRSRSVEIVIDYRYRGY
jgi:hypothetical protein